MSPTAPQCLCCQRGGVFKATDLPTSPRLGGLWKEAWPSFSFSIFIFLSPWVLSFYAAFHAFHMHFCPPRSYLSPVLTAMLLQLAVLTPQCLYAANPHITSSFLNPAVVSFGKNKQQIPTPKAHERQWKSLLESNQCLPFEALADTDQLSLSTWLCLADSCYYHCTDWESEKTDCCSLPGWPWDLCQDSGSPTPSGSAPAHALL